MVKITINDNGKITELNDVLDYCIWDRTHLVNNIVALTNKVNTNNKELVDKIEKSVSEKCHNNDVFPDSETFGDFVNETLNDMDLI